MHDEAPGPAPRTPLLELADMRRYLAMQLVATIAAQVQLVAVGWDVYARTGRALDLGYVGLAQFAPVAGLSLVAGHVADRVPRKHILAATYLLQALCSVALAALTTRPELGVSPIYAVLVLVGIARAFSGPARHALLPDIVPREQFVQAASYGATIWQLATIAGPSSGGLLVSAAPGLSPIYAGCAACFALGGALSASFSPRPSQRKGEPASLSTVLAGLRFVWSNKVMLGAISLDLFAVLLGGAVALMPIFARDILRTGPQGLGLLRAAPAIGAVATALWVARHPIKQGAGKVMLTCVLLFGLATIGFGLSTNVGLSLLCLAALGAADMVSVTIRQTLVQLSTPEEMRGRVSAVNLVFIGASNELGELESGVTAELWGAVPAVLVGGVGTCVVVLLWAIVFPELRRVDRLDTLP